MRFPTMLVPLLLAVLCLITTAFLWRGSLSKTAELPKTELTNAFIHQSSGERGPVRMIRFVLSADGLYPRYMCVGQGLVNIALEDRTNRAEGLVIESLLGDQRKKVTEIRRVENHWRGRVLIRLPPGNYVVSDGSQPSHTAKLVVNP